MGLIQVTLHGMEFALLFTLAFKNATPGVLFRSHYLSSIEVGIVPTDSFRSESHFWNFDLDSADVNTYKFGGQGREG